MSSVLRRLSVKVLRLESSVYYIGRGNFITNKGAIGRKKDMTELKVVGEV